MGIIIRPGMAWAVPDNLVHNLLELDIAHGNYGDFRAIMGLDPQGNDNPYEVYAEDKFVELVDKVFNIDTDKYFQYPGPDYVYRIEGYRSKLLTLLAFCIGKQSGLIMH